MGALARLWYARMLQAAPSTPSPRNGPVVRVGVGLPDRVLLLGNGPVHGWGVTRRELSAPGHLAELLHVRTGRAATVEFVGDERMNAASAEAWLGDAADRGHDVAVIAVGMNDALRLRDVEQWRVAMTALVERVLHEGDSASQVLVVGLPHVRSYLMADTWIGSFAQRRAERLTAVLMGIAASHDRIEFVPAPHERFESDRPLGSSAMYRSWAEGILEPVLGGIDAVRRVRAAVPEPDREWEWAASPAIVEGAEAGVLSPRLEAVVDAVQQRFGVALAAVNLLDGDRARFIAGGVGAPRSMPRSLAYCDTTVRADGPLVVLDAAEDVRFRDNPFLDVVGLPFYAGVPLHALDGRAVATLCVLDASPRTAFDVQDLAQFAAEAEQELQIIESGASAVDAAPAAEGVRAGAES